MPKSPKGSRREREFAEFLTKKGFVVHRVAGSGLKEDAICDLIAVKNGKVHFIECKSRKKTYYTKFHAGQFKELVTIANRCKAKPVLAVKLNYKEWKIFDLNKKIPEKVE
jgi:Holliday junction resolvase